MAKSNDRKHFKDYRDQTRVKHEILAAYLPTYYHILKRWEKNLLFIDGFAGCGTYSKSGTSKVFDGSPLRALRLITENADLTKQVSTIFIESDPVLCQALDQRVKAFYKKNSAIREPTCINGRFSDCIQKIVEEVEGELAPTFLFVDPCGVTGTSFKAIRAVMNCNKCEAFIFFNIDGVRRIAGLQRLSRVLVELLGSKRRAKALYELLRETSSTKKRERLILAQYRKALKKDIGAEYIVTFRVEHERKRKTSHYLIHATKHPLGFRIMKDVMWRRGHQEDQTGGLEFAQRSKTSFVPLFDFRGDEIKLSILEALGGGPMRVSEFYEVWTSRPSDRLCESVYRKTLLELEAAGRIKVLSKDAKNVVGADARLKRKGKPTLAKDYFVKLA